LNAIAALDEEVVLVLDDYHVIATPAIHDAMALLLEHPPARFHLFLGTRDEPPLPVARLRVRDQVNEIRADDLRFHADETATFFADIVGIDLATDEITTLSERADGWVAGLQIAGLTLQKHPEPARFVATFSGNHRHIMNYLGEEVLAAQPEEVQTFLLQTALLERLCAPLCDAMTGRHDGQAILERLQLANLFLVPLDDEVCWYRYYHLFADLLRHRLHQEYGEQVPELHRRAARWLEAEGWISEAVEHLFAVPDMVEATRLIERAAIPLLMRCDVVPVLRLVERVPEDVITTRPFLCLIHGHALFYRGKLVEAERRLTTAECFLQPEYDGEYALDPDQRRKLAAYIAIYKTTLPAMRGDADETIAQAQIARALLSTISRDHLYNEDTLSVPLGLAYLGKGDLAAADASFANGYRASLADRNLAQAALALMMRSHI
ncbi:MAG TPA: hypothetical protein VKB76_18860, partial [Ktedonobacterales bacterium]|nr:hypothetical protein [Ktedonobacterales bacterium]